jgi:threonine dehydrogenase-like Zn-dependent dehydrogenase
MNMVANVAQRAVTVNRAVPAGPAIRYAPLVQALVFDLSLPRYALARAFGKRVPQLHYGRLSCLSLRDVPTPTLRGPDWARLRVARAGVCGSDIATLLFKMSPSMTPFSSTPCVLGHEIFGHLDQVGDAARADGLREGDRVVINPFFGCAVRGLAPPCPSCARGEICTCHRAGDGSTLAPGVCIGYHRDLPGGFGEHVIAHRTQIVKVPDAVPDARAVLLEPLAIGLHAALRRPPDDGERVLIIGGGMIAFAVLAALRLAGRRAHVTLLALADYQLAAARALGADEALRPGPELVERVVQLTSARRHKPILGRDVLTGGFDVTYDCVGSRASLDDALAFTAAGGTVVMVGAAGKLDGLDLTALWSRELKLVGAVGYASEQHGARRRDTFDLTRELVSGDAGRAVDALVTHELPLARYEEALVANIQRERHRAIKTVFVAGA